MALSLTSPAFTEGASIPRRYTCDGDDLSPALAWTGVPAGTRSLALICDDPDAPRGTWTHWVLYDIPAAESGLEEGVPAERILNSGARHGSNSWGRIGYGGPCPPGGTHRYFFTLYALDVPTLGLQPGADADAVRRAMRGHVLAEARLMGTYQRQR